MMSDSRAAASTKNQELRTKNFKNPCRASRSGFFIIQSIPWRLGVIPYQASEPILLEFNIHYSLFNILRRSRNAAPTPKNPCPSNGGVFLHIYTFRFYSYLPML
jgi:hypothetical protein